MKRTKSFMNYVVNTTKMILAEKYRTSIGFYHNSTNTVQLAVGIDDPAYARITIPQNAWIWFNARDGDDTEGPWAIITSASTTVEVYSSREEED
jgi:hypothetical protein